MNPSHLKKHAAFPRYPLTILAAALGLALAGCGGGGGGGSSGGTDTGTNTALAITQQPADQSVLQGGAASFSLTASGTGVSCQWQNSYNKGNTWENLAGPGPCNMTFSGVTAVLDGVLWRAKVTDSAGATVYSSAVKLTVTATTSAPAISVPPAAVVVTEGQTAGLSVTASGTPSPTYQWQVSTDSGATWADVAGATAATYTTAVTATADSGKRYRVVVTNSQGTVTSSAATLTVNPVPVAPTITTAPVAAVSVTAPATASFSVVAAGTAPLSYQWQLSTDNGSTWVDIAGATAASYTTAATTADSGKRYRVVVTNVQGSATSSAAVLTVAATPVAPTITTAPAAASVTAPATATFSVTATGNPTPTYQWQLSTDGGTTWANISGATAASYTTPATAAGDSGKKYRVVVTNSQGSVTSGAAGLTVVGASTATVTGARLALGYGYSLMVKSDGTVLSAGTGMSGGDGSIIPNTSVRVVSGISSVSYVSAGNHLLHASFAIRQDGSLFGWGDSPMYGASGWGGGLGGVAATGRSLYSVPVPSNISLVAGVSAVEPFTNGATLIAKRDGTVWAMGDSIYITTMPNGTLDATTNAKQVAGLSNITAIGTAYAGLREEQVVVPIVAESGALSLLTWTAPKAYSYTTSGSTQTYSSSYSIASVSGLPEMVLVNCAGGGNGTTGHCLGLSKYGVVWAWGGNSYGQLGLGNVSGAAVPTQIAGLSGVVQVVTTASYSLALTASGDVYSWGYGNYLGHDPSSIQGAILSPRKISGLSGVVEIASLDSGYYGYGGCNMLARKADGTVWVWGANYSGELGTGTTSSVATPVQMPGVNLN